MLTQEIVKNLATILVADYEFRNNFQKNPYLTIKKLNYDISEKEIEALLKIKFEDISSYQKNRRSSNINNLETLSSIMSA